MGDPTVADVDAAAAPPPPSKSDSLFMQIAIHPDGTVTRPVVPAIPASDAGAVSSIPSTPLWARTSGCTSPTTSRSPRSSPSSSASTAAASSYSPPAPPSTTPLPAIVASLEYHLAPEHRLPAAYDDAVAAVLWLRDVAPRDPWVAAHGDVARCFVMGSSSGANMAFNASVRTKGVDLSPAAVRGLLLHQPYLGGVERTPSEARSEDDHMLPLEANDMLWSLALPLGADRDHKFSNPTKAMAREAVVGLPRCLVSGSDGDPLIDRQRGFATWLRDSGMEVVDKTDGSGFHAAELFVPEKAEEMFVAVREFVSAGGDIDA